MNCRKTKNTVPNRKGRRQSTELIKSRSTRNRRKELENVCEMVTSWLLPIKFCKPIV